MNELSLVVRTLSSLLSILGIVFLLFWLYRDYRIDKFRQSMFLLRDELFDWVQASEISFDHPAYGMLRSAMNGFIRFGHRLSLSQLGILFFLTCKETDVVTFRKRWDDAIRSLHGTKRSELEEFRMRMHIVVCDHLFMSPPIIVTVVLPVVAWMISTFCIQRVMELLRKPFDGIDTAAVAVGQ